MWFSNGSSGKGFTRSHCARSASSLVFRGRPHAPKHLGRSANFSPVRADYGAKPLEVGLGLGFRKVEQRSLTIAHESSTERNLIFLRFGIRAFRVPNNEGEYYEHEKDSSCCR
jgi:hypothetical protein